MGLDKLVLHCQRLTTLEARAFHSYGKGVGRLKVARGSLREALFSSQPVNNYWRLPLTRHFSTLIFLVFIGVWAWDLFRDNRIPMYRHYRFTNLETRGGTTAPQSPGIQRFGLLREGVGPESRSRVSSQGQTPQCRPRGERGWELRKQGPSMVLSVPSEEQGSWNIGGWYIVSLAENGTEAEDAVRFKLEGSDDPSFPDPALVGSSTFVVHNNGKLDLSLGVADMPLPRMGFLSVVPDVGFLKLRVSCYAFVIVAFTGAMILAASFGHAQHCKSILVFGLAASGLFRLIAGTILLMLDMPWDHGKAYFIRDYVMSLAFFCFTLTLVYAEQYWEWNFLLLSIMQTASTVLVQQAFLPEAPRFLEFSQVNAWASMCWVFLIWGSRLRFAVQVSQNALGCISVQEFFAIRKDIEVYEAAWVRVAREQRDDIQALSETVKSLKKEAEERVPRQLNRAVLSGLNTYRSSREFSFMQSAGAEGASGHRESFQRQSFEDSTRSDGRFRQLQASPSSPPFVTGSGVRVAPDDLARLGHRRSGSGIFFSSKILMGSQVSSEPDCETQTTMSFLEHNVLQSTKLAKYLKGAMYKSVSGHRPPLDKPVDSIDQLHAQAFLVADLFLDFVVNLAANCNGKFKVKQTAGAARDQGVEVAAWNGCEESRSRFELGGIKSIESATRKYSVSYRGDVSMLLDMVRETLYFDTVGELTECLKRVQSDPHVEIVRVKSTFGNDISKASNSGRWGWAGMRFVSVNLRLVGNQDAQALCVDTHVCELLLVLTDTMRVQTVQMKARYHMWRIVRTHGSTGSPHFSPLLASALGFLTGMRSGASGSHHGGRRGSDTTVGTQDHGSSAALPPLEDAARATSTPFSVLSGDSLKEGREREHTACERSERGDVSLAEPRMEGDGETGTRETTATQDQGVSSAKGEALVANRHHTLDPPPPREVLRMPSPMLAVGPRRGSKASSSASQASRGESQGQQPAELVTSWGASLCPEVRELVEGLCHLSVLGLFDFIDKRWDLVLDYSRSNNRSNFSTALFSQHPISGATHRWQFQIMLLILGCYYGYQGIQGSASRTLLMAESSFGPYKHYRLQTMLTRNGSQGASVRGPGVSDFGVLGVSRCPVIADGGELPSFSGPLGSSFLVSHPQGWSMTGWYLVSGAANGTEPQDPSFFEVFATNDDFEIGNGSCALAREDVGWWESGFTVEWCGARWDKVGAPMWGYKVGATGTKNGKPWDFCKTKIELPPERGMVQHFVLPPYWDEFDFAHVFAYFFASLACICCSLAGALSNYIPGVPSPHLFIGYGLLGTTLSNFAAFCAVLVRAQTHTALDYFFRAATTLILVVICLRQGPWVLRGMAAYVVLNIGSVMLLSHWYWLRLEVSSGGMAILAMLLCLISARTWALRTSQRLLREDQEKYDALYSALLLNDESQLEIRHLMKVVKMTGLPSDGDNSCRQHNHMLVSKLPPRQRAEYTRVPPENILVNPVLREFGQVFVPGRTDAASAVSSVNQLYASASIALLLVEQRIKVWAEKTDGMFLVRRSGDGCRSRDLSLDSLSCLTDQQTFVKWNDVKELDPSMQGFCRVSLKRYSRAIEKLLRSYAHDPSRLMDISRCCIIYPTLTELTRALGIIITDENVRMERLKNRLDPRHKSEETAGYRDVCLNFRVVNREAKSLGVDVHVCELQLILADFAKLRTAEGHVRYVQARNKSGN